MYQDRLSIWPLLGQCWCGITRTDNDEDSGGIIATFVWCLNRTEPLSALNVQKLLPL